MKIYRCKHCGNIVTLLTDKGGKLSCCNDEMELLNANTVDASVEKHVPVIEKDGNIVNMIEGSSDFEGWKTRINEELSKVEG